MVGLAGHQSALPSAPTAAPLLAPLPVLAPDAVRERGRIVSRTLYSPRIPDLASVVGEAWRAVYMSTSGLDGGPRAVSGAFFVPTGTAPAGGWPVISLAHGTTGIGLNCGPSAQPDLQGYAPIVASLLENGYAVALTDYEGLGAEGVHPYLEPRTEAFNTIDAVRALRQLTPSVSNRWVALGYSQGGQAVWAANELNGFYGGELALLGSVALAPAANVTGVADLAWSSSLTEQQRELLPLLVVGVGRYSPGIDAGTLLRGRARLSEQRLGRCESTGSPAPKARAAPVPWRSVVDRVSGSNNVRPATAADASALRNALQKVALPQSALSEPMLVVTGRSDALVLPGWVSSAVSAACALGGQIDYLELPDVDHRTIVWKSSGPVMDWIESRFAGAPPPSECADGATP